MTRATSQYDLAHCTVIRMSCPWLLSWDEIICEIPIHAAWVSDPCLKLGSAKREAGVRWRTLRSSHNEIRTCPNQSSGACTSCYLPLQARMILELDKIRDT